MNKPMTSPRIEAARAYLNRIRKAKDRVLYLQGRLDNIQLMLSDIALHMTGLPRGDSPDLQKGQTLQAEKDELEREIARAREELVEVCEEVEGTIRQIRDVIVQRAIILHYVQGKSLRETEKIMKRSHSQLKVYLKAGLMEVSLLLE